MVHAFRRMDAWSQTPSGLTRHVSTLWGRGPAQDGIRPHLLVIRPGVVAIEVQAPALLAGGGAGDDQLGNVSDVTKLEQVHGDEVAPVILADLLLQEGDAA